MADRTIEELSERIEYDASTGELVWKHSNIKWFKDQRSWKGWNTRYAGKKACHVRPDGRIVVSLRGKKIFAHRVAFALCHGRWPENEVDHANGNCSDNRIANLADSTRSENMRNQRLKKTNKSGMTGVIERGDKWGAFIGVEGKAVWLGTYGSKSDAAAARKAAENSYGYHPNHGRATS